MPPAASCVSGHTINFTDVACPDFFANFIEQLSHDAITGGCGPSLYCPTNPVTRGVFFTACQSSSFISISTRTYPG